MPIVRDLGTDPTAAVDWSVWQGSIGDVVSPLVSGEAVLVIGAHPDDETIGAGRLLASHDGRREAVVLTAGEGCVGDVACDRSAMGERRLAEWRSAMPRLGVTVREGPHWPDGGIASCRAEVEAHLVAVVADFDCVLCTWALDPHPDHRAAGEAARAACAIVGVRLVEYPVWAPFWMSPDDVAAVGAGLSRVRTHAAAKRARSAALEHYSSQTEPLGVGWSPIVPAELLRRHEEQLVVTVSA